MIRHETDDLESWEYVEWELTDDGREMFPLVGIGEQPVKVQGNGRWWDK